MTRQLHILHLEDDPVDAELVQLNLTRGGIQCQIMVVTTAMAFSAALEQGTVNLILADLSLPDFDGMTALSIVRERYPHIPFIFVSGRLGEEAAIESLKNGATDYVLKNRLSRLAPAVKRALVEAAERTEHLRAEQELARAYSEIQDRAESYQNLFNSIRDVIVVAGHDRRILTVNQPALRETFGYELDEVVGKSARLLYAETERFNFIGKEIYGRQEAGKGKILEVFFRKKNGQTFIGELYAFKRLDRHGVATGNIGIIRDISERKKAEEALRQSEMRRYQFLVELKYAAEIQSKLLPRSYPNIPGFEIAAQCLPAKQVGGDFFDWQELEPGALSLTLGDVMGKGMAAAMLMATVRAAIRSVARNRPATALVQAERALLPDLENSESFVTLFHALLTTSSRTLTFVDCGHGFVFLRRENGAVEDLLPRDLPLGVPGKKLFQEGTVVFQPGDALVLFSDGLIDARPELALNNTALAAQLGGQVTAQEMVERLVELTDQEGEQLPDDVTVLVVRCLR